VFFFARLYNTEGDEVINLTRISILRIILQSVRISKEAQERFA
jgi:hypothetical protein